MEISVHTRGTSLVSQVTWSHDRYDRADPNISTVKCRDDVLRLRSVFSLPFTTLAGLPDAPGLVRDATISLGVEYERVFSKIDNYRYQNVRVIATFTKHFDF